MTAGRVPGDFADALVSALKSREQTVATCESLTAGLAAATIAAVPGSSAVLRGGLITYATELKHELAGVDADVLSAHGPVAAETAEQMALGTRRKCGADWGISLTGVAGPEPQDGHAVGEVFLGIAGPDGVVETLRVLSEDQPGHSIGSGDGEPLPLLEGDRSQIRRRSVDFAVHQLFLRVMEQNCRDNR